CTVAASATSANNLGVAGPTTDKTLVLGLQNNIFSLPGSTKGVIALDASPGTLTLTSGTNLRFLGAASAPTDALTGTVIDADPILVDDLIHVDGASPAINAGADLGANAVKDDIDGEPRPG